MIYDCVTLFNDVELVELRFMTLYDTVDRFVVVEAEQSHIREEKPLFYLENRELFKPYADKVIYIHVPELPYDNPRDNEFYQRNLISYGLDEAGPEDYIIIGDIDEMARPEALLEGIAKYEQFGLLQKLFYYYVNCQAVQMWYGSMCWKKKYIVSPQDVRNRRGGDPHGVDNGGWHYSFLGGAEKIMLKIRSFSEQQVNTPDVNNEENILKCLESGEDIFHRTEPWAKKSFISREEAEIDHPALKQWLQKYPHNVK